MDLQVLGKSPISAENPAGEDIRYTAVFEDLQAEVDKLSSPTAAAESIDWAKISTLAAEILAHTSKDLLVAAYFSVAQIHLSHIEGLELGLQIYADLLENFWDTVFPQMRRMRGRVAAIEWWLEKGEVAIRLTNPAAIKEPERDRILAQCERIDQILAENLPENQFAIHAMMQAVQAIPLELSRVAPSVADRNGSEAKAPPETSVPAPAPQPAQKTAPRDNPPPARSETIAADSLDSQLLDLGKTATTFFEEDKTNPLSYRLLRFSLWSLIESLPPATDGRTLVPPPDPQVAMILRDIFTRGDWEAMLSAAEYQLPQYIFWLDLNRFSALSLKNMGYACNSALDSLVRETAFFINRFPGLVNLQFSDGTPFADQETVDWLKSTALDSSEATIAQGAISAGDSSDSLAGKIAEVMQQAQALVKEKNLIDAVALFQQEIRLVFAAKERMLWRLALCRFLINSKNTVFAVAHFDQIVADIENYRLEEWDPMLALHSLKIIWAGLQKVSDGQSKERAISVLHQIARIDSVEALRIGNK